MRKEVLVIEDDPDIVDLLSIHLNDLDCKVTSSMLGEKGLELAQKEKFDLIILDLMLPDMDGMEICRQIRAHKNYTPILMLTAKSEDIDKILGLESGADDYLTKPFNVREFISRVKAIFRRIEMMREEREPVGKKMEYRGLQIDVEMRKVLLDGTKLALTPKEFDLLVLLATNRGKSYSREKLLNQVWGYEFLGYEHTVNSHINRLRSKIERDLNNPEFILTTWGVGYRFNDED